MTFPTEAEIKAVLQRGQVWAEWTGAYWLSQEIESILSRMNDKEETNGLVCAIDWSVPQEGCNT